ncbi:MAG: hypothetical protein QOC71_144 [Thermoplasmata archaeon]|jgi:hypothetical protein|nr:hypothetical protein [Thermoplasmata archaeon]
MKGVFLAAALVAVVALALPPAQAAPPSVIPPPQCFTSGCCFAPCPSPCYTTCPPPCATVCPTPLRCPEQSIEPVTSAIHLPVGTVVAAETHSDCSANVCVDQEGGNRCDDQACDSADATCCDLGARASCGCEETSVATSDYFAYMGPHSGVDVSKDCKVSTWHDQPPIECTCDPMPVILSSDPST